MLLLTSLCRYSMGHHHYSQLIMQYFHKIIFFSFFINGVGVKQVSHISTCHSQCYGSLLLAPLACPGQASIQSIGSLWTVCCNYLGSPSQTAPTACNSKRGDGSRHYNREREFYLVHILSQDIQDNNCPMSIEPVSAQYSLDT